jgi:hypothetical protein
VAGSTRRSSTRGRATSTRPTPVAIARAGRGRCRPPAGARARRPGWHSRRCRRRPRPPARPPASAARPPRTTRPSPGAARPGQHRLRPHSASRRSFLAGVASPASFRLVRVEGTPRPHARGSSTDFDDSSSKSALSRRSPYREARSGVKIGPGRPPTSSLFGLGEAVSKSDAGSCAVGPSVLP